MAHKQVALELAGFLDRMDPSAIAAADRATVRSLVELFLTVCYEDLGKKPRLLDGDEMQTALSTCLPARLAPGDRRIEHARPILEAYLQDLEATQVVPQAFEMRRAFEGGVDAMIQRVRAGENAAEQRVVRSTPFVHGATKLGRNDPCSCGSGKKFKKCHGKGL